LLPDIRTDFSTDSLIHLLNETLRIGNGIIIQPASGAAVQTIKDLFYRAALIPSQQFPDIVLETGYRYYERPEGYTTEQ